MAFNKTAGLVAGGVVLGVIGAYFLFSPTTVKQFVKAQTNYEINWKASRVLTVESSGFFGNIPPQEVAIGVAGWEVEGNVGDTNFQETWVIPTIGGDGVVFNPANLTTSGPGFNPDHWLFANHVGMNRSTPNGGKVTYRIRDLTFLNNSYTYIKNDAKVGGNAIRCASNSDSNCLQARGAYGWEVYHALSNMGSERGRVSASGVMMPLHWKVTGTISN